MIHLSYLCLGNNKFSLQIVCYKSIEFKFVWVSNNSHYFIDRSFIEIIYFPLFFVPFTFSFFHCLIVHVLIYLIQNKVLFSFLHLCCCPWIFFPRFINRTWQPIVRLGLCYIEKNFELCTLESFVKPDIYIMISSYVCRLAASTYMPVVSPDTKVKSLISNGIHSTTMSLLHARMIRPLSYGTFPMKVYWVDTWINR